MAVVNARSMVTVRRTGIWKSSGGGSGDGGSDVCATCEKSLWGVLGPLGEDFRGQEWVEEGAFARGMAVLTEFVLLRREQRVVERRSGCELRWECALLLVGFLR